MSDPFDDMALALNKAHAMADMVVNSGYGSFDSAEPITRETYFLTLAGFLDDARTALHAHLDERSREQQARIKIVTPTR